MAKHVFGIRFSMYKMNGSWGLPIIELSKNREQIGYRWKLRVKILHIVLTIMWCFVEEVKPEESGITVVAADGYDQFFGWCIKKGIPIPNKNYKYIPTNRGVQHIRSIKISRVVYIATKRQDIKEIEMFIKSRERGYKIERIYE